MQAFFEEKHYLAGKFLTQKLKKNNFDQFYLLKDQYFHSSVKN